MAAVQNLASDFCIRW